MKALSLLLLATPAFADPWIDGEHATGACGGARDTMLDHGVDLDAAYTAEGFATVLGRHGTTLLGHADLALTLDTGKLGLWSGGTFYIYGQDTHGTGVDQLVGSISSVSNLEAYPGFTQLGELFYEQAFSILDVRVGKQDANRDFGTPRFSGNFDNNNFGMFPTVPLPSYPTTGLGLTVKVQPTAALTGVAAVYESDPAAGGLGLGTALQSGHGAIAVGGGGYAHHYGVAGRDGGTTSFGVWHRTTDGADGVFAQNDERIYRHPGDPNDPSGLTLIARAAWATRGDPSRYAGLTAAWHGLGFRHDDTIGVAGGTLRGARDEWFAEAFYKERLTKLFSLQLDVEGYRHPDSLAIGLRVKVKG